jgi:hypothetical protein
MLSPEARALLCVAHPAIETDLGCSRCGVAICPRCLVQTPVGGRCRSCASVRRVPTYNLSRQAVVRAAAAAVVGGAAMGVGWWAFNYLTYQFYFGILTGLMLGFLIGELVAVACNRRAGPPLQAIAVAGVIIAYAVRMALVFTLDGWILEDLRYDAEGLIATVLGCFIAASRLK